ncbi:hypothetical protein [Streptomyces sp. NBC_00083]|uniref:hypothetical protein n=1 Tax=Streptomyces sp. NBC_00083 TaxID=2975647 RepID=UPI00225B295C|nr:hypothetical protein [Streptomyces sp. NBC_00083]MCX5387658.1 hypothetical protein [Streptomyces sp. NBC_00083]
MTSSLTRRQALSLGVGASAVIALTTSGTSQAASGTREALWNEPRSANGWPVLNHATTQQVEGTNVAVALAEGDAAIILRYVARRFAYEVDMLRTGDLHGHTTDRKVGAAFESNYLSGTAIAIRPLHYPLRADVKNTGMSESERIVIADILADCEGVVTWGGNLEPVKQSHFEIAVMPDTSSLRKLAAQLQGRNDTPGQGAGAIDAFAASRRRSVARFQQAH